MKTFLLLILIVPILETNGQNKAYLGFSGLIDIPSANFSKHGYKIGAGISFEYYSKDLIFKKSETWGLRLGGSCFVAGHNSVTNNVLLHDPYQAPGSQKLNNNHTGFDFQTMFIHEKGSTIKPYVDIFIGGGFFTSNQDLTINQPVKGYQSTTTDAHGSASLDYGFSSGVLVKISKRTFINLKGSVYCFTNKIQFDDLNHLGDDGFMKVPDYVSVKPLMYSFQAGFIFKLLANPAGPYHRGTSHYHGYYGGGGFHGGGGMMLR